MSADVIRCPFCLQPDHPGEMCDRDLLPDVVTPEYAEAAAAVKASSERVRGAGTEQFDADPVALVEQELPTPSGEPREAWARTILTRLIEGGWEVVRFDQSTGVVVDAWGPHRDEVSA